MSKRHWFRAEGPNNSTKQPRISTEQLAGKADLYSCFAQGIQPPMHEQDALVICVPFSAAHDMRKSSKDAAAHVATQARKAKIEISNRKLNLQDHARKAP